MYEHEWEKMEGGIREHLVIFRRLVALAVSYLNKHRYEAAAVYAQVAAHYAWWNHTGLFASPQIENILQTIGQNLNKPNVSHKERETKPQLPERILHVLTQAYATGGHTRLVRRWIEQDMERTHSMVLTRQGLRSVPEEIDDVISRARGRIYLLDAKPGGLLSRAKALRQLAKSFDKIILHVHPYDVVPVIAFTEKCAPVIFMNHADHVFWIGVGVSDVVAHIREGSLSLSQERRGIEGKRCQILPLPLESRLRRQTRAEAKKRLGFDENTVVLLSIATPYKYQSINGISFVDALLPLIMKYEKAVLLVIGPDASSDSDRWAEAQDKTRGRIKVLGVQEDLTHFYQSADIYVDSFPMSSLTSVLDAGCYSLPAVRYHIFHDAASLLRGDDPGLTEKTIDFTDLNEYQEEISRLIENESLRLDKGESIGKNISERHLGSGWKRALESLYQKAAAVSRSTWPSQIKEHSINELDIALSWLHTNNGVSQGLDAILRAHSRLLPLRPRMKAWASMCREQHRLLPFYLLSESVGTRFERKIWG